VATFKEKDLYDCLIKEPRSEGVFYNADVEIKKALKEKKNALGVKGIVDILGFIVDMTRESIGGKPTCNVLWNKSNNWDTLHVILKEMRAPSTGLKIDDGKFTFNNQDITDEANMMTEAYVAQDLKKFGFLLGDTLSKHSVTTTGVAVLPKDNDLFLY